MGRNCWPRVSGLVTFAGIAIHFRCTVNVNLSKSHQSFLVILLAAAFTFLAEIAKADPFQNLDFESSTVSGTTIMPSVPVSTLFPFWTLRFQDTIQTTAVANALPLDTDAIALLASPPDNILQGTHTAYLQAAIDVPGVSGPHNVSIAQTGDVPVDAKSIRFIARNPFFDSLPLIPGPFVVTLGGQNIPLILLSSSNGDASFAGDVSTFAGLTTELRIAVVTHSSVGEANEPEG